MLVSLGAALLSSAAFTAAQAIDPQLTGTWSTKSNSTFTGPGFYNPVKEMMYEPSHTGISYSFTDDGYYETSYYRSIANPTNPQCPQGMLQWQHGTFQKLSNGSLTLTPYGVDGRQLMSDPCNYQNSIYSRYNQSEFMQRYSIYIDPYHQVWRMDMYRFDGSPLPAMYLAYRPPQMLPTSTLNPTATSTGAAKSTASSKVRRAMGLVEQQGERPPLDFGKLKKKYGALVEPERWWWIGVGLTGFGSVLYFCF